MRNLNELQKELLDQILIDFHSYIETGIDNHDLDVNVTSFIEMESKTKWDDDIDFSLEAENIIREERKNIENGNYTERTQEIVRDFRRLSGSSISDKILTLAGFQKDNPVML